MFNTVFQEKIEALGPLRDAREAVGFIPLLRDFNTTSSVSSAGTLLGGVVDAHRVAIYGVFWMVAVAAAVGFFVSCFIEEKSLEREELGRQQFEECKSGEIGSKG